MVRTHVQRNVTLDWCVTKKFFSGDIYSVRNTNDGGADNERTNKRSGGDTADKGRGGIDDVSSYCDFSRCLLIICVAAGKESSNNNNNV